MSIKFLVLRGGGYFGFGGGSADFIFMGARIFLSLGSLLARPCSLPSPGTPGRDVAWRGRPFLSCSYILKPDISKWNSTLHNAV